MCHRTKDMKKGNRNFNKIRNHFSTHSLWHRSIVIFERSREMNFDILTFRLLRVTITADLHVNLFAGYLKLCPPVLRFIFRSIVRHLRGCIAIAFVL